MSDTKIIPDYSDAGTIDAAQDKFLLWQNATNTYRSINRNTILGVSGQPVDTSTAQNITNKTLDNTNVITVRDDRLTLQDNLDTTKQAQFQLSGITTATTRTYTLPNASSTLADISTSQTFTNKTLTSPVITGGSITNSSISVDSISEYTSANGVTIDGLNIKDGKLNTSNSVVNTNITDGAVTPNKLQSGTGTGWSWVSYTPTWTGASGNPSVGNGTLSGSYVVIGKTVIVNVKLIMGSTTTYGSGEWSFSLPVSVISSKSFVGSAGGIQTAVAYRTGVVANGPPGAITPSTTGVNIFSAGSTNAWSSTIPHTWVSTNTLSFNYTYETT